MTDAETIAAELERIQSELQNIAYWRTMTVKLTEIRMLDRAEREWTEKAYEWMQFAEKVRRR